MQEVFEALAVVGFLEVPESVTQFLQLLFSNFGQTKVVEDGFQRCRSKDMDRPDKDVGSIPLEHSNIGGGP